MCYLLSGLRGILPPPNPELNINELSLMLDSQKSAEFRSSKGMNNGVDLKYLQDRSGSRLWGKAPVGVSSPCCG